MRLTPNQLQDIRICVQQHLGLGTRLWLFGSRLDDSRRGGDVDLYAEPDQPVTLVPQLRCQLALKDALELDVDLIVAPPGQDDTPIARIAKRGEPLL